MCLKCLHQVCARVSSVCIKCVHASMIAVYDASSMMHHVSCIIKMLAAHHSRIALQLIL